MAAPIPFLSPTAADARYSRSGPSPQRGTLVPVATRTALAYVRQKKTSTSSVMQETSRLSHVITADCFRLRIYYGNIGSNASGSSPVDGDNSITVRCDVQSADGRRKRGWTAGGSRSLTIEPGGMGSFEVQGVFKKGDRIYTRTNVSVATAGQTWPRNLTANTGLQAGLGEGVTESSDLTLPSTTAVTQSFVWAYGPAMILGEVPAPVPVIANIGDSISNGAGDSGAEYGFVARALGAASIGMVSLAADGETSTGFLAADEGGGRAPALNFVTHAICEYGVNDFYNTSTSLATWQSNVLTIWTALARRGVKVYQTTITPKATSTDSWATTANQTPDGATSIRNAGNDWIRAGAPIDPTTKSAVAVGTSGALVAGATGHPLTAYFEIADVVETARNSGLWKVSGAANYGTADGTHPTATLHALMAAAIDTSKLALT